ncbi:MAG TPA: efflux RND transporter periplasmic adaptor subunit [Pirellulales bacterium]|nr:efflux RND transporter periplasmic adaptor subunit [Pirellulales bacterium]
MKQRIAIVLGLLAVAAAATAVWWFGAEQLAAWNEKRSGSEETVSLSEATDLPLYIDVLPKVVELSGIRTAEVKKPTRPRVLELRGQLNFDPNSLVHVHARFPGQVIELGTVPVTNPNSLTSGLMHTERALAFGDHVSKGQELAKLWSKDLGEKKSELVTSLIRYRTNRLTSRQFKKAEKDAAIANRAVREIERQMEQDATDIERARMTLLSWGLPKEAIDRVEADAERIHRDGGTRDIALENEWAQVSILAPMNGTIVEKNVVEGGLVDTDDDLFKIADLSRLRAVLHVYEEDLPFLQEMEQPVPWTIHITSRPEAPPISGWIDQLSDVIEPTEHMALAFGTVENPKRDLFALQFITAQVVLPEEPNLLEIPTRALVEDGVSSNVLVQVDPQRSRYVLRRVLVARRYHDVVYIRSPLTDEQKRQGLEELHVGELVVSAGALELRAALEQARRAGETKHD